jgi:methylglutaconyl-CoA hydratase
MGDYETIRCTVDRVGKVVLHRPKIRNAFNETMITELHDAFDVLAHDEGVRVIVFTGEGTCFCSGADLNWMRGVVDYTYEQNLQESLNLAELMYCIYSHPKPVIGRVNGPAIGGGTGLVAATDIAICSDTARFSFSEVKIGVVPACISPYVVRRVGESRAREFFLTGERLTAERALEAGLVNQVVPADELDGAIDALVAQLLSSGPHALTICKELLEKVPQMGLEEAKRYTAEVIARLRQSEEGQEGMAAYLEKRKPTWVP